MCCALLCLLGIARKSSFDSCQAIFNGTLFQGTQQHAGQKPNRIRCTKIKRALPNTVDRFFQEFAHFPNVFQWSLGKVTFISPPSAILLSSLPTQSSQFFGMRVKKAQAPFHSRRLARATSLRLSRAVSPAPLL
jgi:hypothetical protein